MNLNVIFFLLFNVFNFFLCQFQQIPDAGHLVSKKFIYQIINELKSASNVKFLSTRIKYLSRKFALQLFIQFSV